MQLAHIAEIKLDHADDCGDPCHCEHGGYPWWIYGAMHVPAGGEVLV